MFLLSRFIRRQLGETLSNFELEKVHLALVILLSYLVCTRTILVNIRFWYAVHPVKKTYKDDSCNPMRLKAEKTYFGLLFPVTGWFC